MLNDMRQRDTLIRCFDKPEPVRQRGREKACLARDLRSMFTRQNVGGEQALIKTHLSGPTCLKRCGLRLSK